MTISYQSYPTPVRSDFAESHERFWRRLASPGSWWSGAERVDIARDVRRAQTCRLCAARKTALSPYGGNDEHDSASGLPTIAVDAVHRITIDASRLTAAWYRSMLEAGLSEGQYVEIVGTVVSVVSIDSFCDSLGLPRHALPDPVSGAPDGYRPSSAAIEEAWVPVVPEDNADTEEADLWPAGRTGYVVRAMSLVPEEVRTLKDLSGAHYLPMRDVANPEASRGSLSRSQIELIAGRVSALNECFY